MFVRLFGRVGRSSYRCSAIVHSGAVVHSSRPAGCFLSDPPPSVTRVNRSSSAKAPAKSNTGVADMVAGPDRDKALALALAQIDKQFGKGSVMRLGERPVGPA